MGQIAAAEAGNRIIRITRTRFTYLVTVEDTTGQIIDHLTRAFATEDEARSMARNAYRFYSLTLAA